MTYGAQCWTLRERNRKRFEALEMDFIRRAGLVWAFNENGKGKAAQENLLVLAAHKKKKRYKEFEMDPRHL